MINLIKRKVLPKHQSIEGKWRIDEVILISLNIDIPLRKKEYHIVEDNLEASSFEFAGNEFFYTSNHLFPKMGNWQLLSSGNIRLFTKNNDYTLEMANNKLFYKKTLDDLVSFKVFFKKI